MSLCINCNSNQVARAGDTFTCSKCGYVWDVAHERANAQYLASQGREPAQPMADIEAASDLDAALSMEPIQVQRREPQVPAGDERARIEAILETKTVAELEESAAQAGIDLTEARLKADKIAALIESGQVYLAEDQQTLVVVHRD